MLATTVVATSADALNSAATVLGMRDPVGLPQTVMADTGYAGGPAVKASRADNVQPLVAIGRSQSYRPYDFRPPPEPEAPRRIMQPCRLFMKARCRSKKQVGLIKSAMGFRRFHLRGIITAAAKRMLIALAYYCRRVHRLKPA